MGGNLIAAAFLQIAPQGHGIVALHILGRIQQDQRGVPGQQPPQFFQGRAGWGVGVQLLKIPLLEGLPTGPGRGRTTAAGP